MSEKTEQIARDISEQFADEGIDACAASVSHELALLVMLYKEMTPAQQLLLDMQLRTSLPIMLSTCAALEAQGPAILQEKTGKIREAFDEALNEGGIVTEEIVGSIRKAGEDLADIIDKAVALVKITASNEKWFNREAHLDLLRGHALIVSALNGLDTVPECFEPESDGQPESVN